ncbi:MAG: hypothetical protein FD180_665 [Planctomycetota bacterium]|nr:MAG: hypothetical protein FD180_665 [Planctomycetota bacterium]
MRRVRANIELVALRLKEMGYRFGHPEAAHVPPTAADRARLDEIESWIGPIPLCLRLFYEEVGSVDLTREGTSPHWCDDQRDRATSVDLLGVEDPLYVKPILALHRDLGDALKFPPPKRWLSVSRGYEEHQGQWYCQFADDEFHKANYSGGENYHVYLPDRAADFRIYDLRCNTGEASEREWFVDYLRKTIAGGGFRGGIQVAAESEDWTKELPRTALVEQLSRDLLQF